MLTNNDANCKQQNDNSLDEDQLHVRQSYFSVRYKPNPVKSWLEVLRALTKKGRRPETLITPGFQPNRSHECKQEHRNSKRRKKQQDSFCTQCVCRVQATSAECELCFETDQYYFAVSLRRLYFSTPSIDVSTQECDVKVF